MKRVFLFFIIAMAIVSCSSEASKLEKKAEIQAVNWIKELSRDPDNCKVDKFHTVYKSDSLCIIHFNHTGKNGFGNEITSEVEYICLIHGSNTYESIHEAKPDSIYLNPTAMQKEQKGKIYQNCTYDEAIKYRAIINLNTTGRIVGNHEEPVNIPVPTGTGNWELDTYVDNFGDHTNDSYLRLRGKGKFSNSATTNDDLTVLLLVDKGSVRLRLIEYGWSVVKDEELCAIIVKDCEGITKKWAVFNNSSGYISLSRSQEDEFAEIAKKGGTISFSAAMGRYSRSTYNFKLDVTGYEEAMKYLD